jgi:putative transposase
VVVPDLPHHVTQRGNRRQRIFFETGDEQVYLDLLSARLPARGGVLELLSHAQSRPPGATPSDEKGLAVGEAHRRYTVFVAARAGWTGHLSGPVRLGRWTRTTCWLRFATSPSTR